MDTVLCGWNTAFMLTGAGSPAGSGEFVTRTNPSVRAGTLLGSTTDIFFRLVTI
jgi:hypothetical protein